MKKQIAMLLLSLVPAAGITQALAQKNVLNDVNGAAGFGKNALSEGQSTLSGSNVLSPRGANMSSGNAIPTNRADMSSGNAIPTNRADMSSGNAIPSNRADMSSGNAIPSNRADMSSGNVIPSNRADMSGGNVIPNNRADMSMGNAIGRGESALEANNVIEGRSSTGEASNVLGAQGNGLPERAAFAGSSGGNVLGASEGVDARRSAFRASVIDEQANAFGGYGEASVGGIQGALMVATPGEGSGVAAISSASNVLSGPTSAFSESFRERLTQRNEDTTDDQWWEAKNAFDGTITESKPERTGFGKSAFD